MTALLPYELHRAIFRWRRPQGYRTLVGLRAELPDKLNAPTFKPLVDNKCIFVHIPKTGGNSIRKNYPLHLQPPLRK